MYQELSTTSVARSKVLSGAVTKVGQGLDWEVENKRRMYYNRGGKKIGRNKIMTKEV